MNFLFSLVLLGTTFKKFSMLYRAVVRYETRFVSTRSETKFFSPADTLTRVVWMGEGDHVIAWWRVVSHSSGILSAAGPIYFYDRVDPANPNSETDPYQIITRLFTAWARSQSVSLYIFFFLFSRPWLFAETTTKTTRPRPDMIATLFHQTRRQSASFSVLPGAASGYCAESLVYAFR
jgi:hypothetical protein